MKRLIVVVALGALALAACGGSDDSSSEPSGTSADGETVATAAADDVASADTVADDEGGDNAPEVVVAPSSGDGSCDVNVSGDKQAEWSGGGTLADVLVSYWFDDAAREVMGDGFTILLNCTGDDGNALSIFSTPAADESNVPQGPGTYELTVDEFTDDGALVESDLFGLLITLVDSETNWRVADPGGTLIITEFDGDSITGTFELPMEDALAEITGDQSEGTIMVTGSFDFNRPETP